MVKTIKDNKYGLQADGKTVADYDYNVDVTRKVVDMAHKLGVTVESCHESGCVVFALSTPALSAK